MKWAEKEVASLKLSKKLKELGFPQKEPGWFWCLRKDSEFYDLFFTMDKMYFYKPKQYEEFFIFEHHHLQDYIKAYTNSELGELLSFYLPELEFLRIEKNEDGFHYYYDGLNITEWYAIEKIEANARAKIIIWLKENGYITFNQGDTNAQSRQQA